MKILLSARLGIASLLLFALSAHLQAQQREKPTAWTPALTLKVNRVGSVQVSPNSKRVAYTVRQAVMENDHSEYRTQIYLAHTDGSKSWQLTQGEKSCDDP